MILNLASLAFNLEIQSGGGTPAWGTELGQGEGYKFSFEDMSDFFTSMVYTSIPDIENVTCPLGKGGNQRNDYEFVIASLYHKVFVNGKRIPNERFLLLVIKKLVGQYHVGRRTLKYNPKMTYRGEEINSSCYNAIPQILGWSNNSGWFINEITVQNQDELHFTAYSLNENGPESYHNNEERKQAMISKLQQDKGRIKVAPQTPSTSSISSRQVIYYGAPGTGKSHKIKEILTQQNVQKENIFRTTFHPDSDYSTFVGAYKPTRGKKPLYGLNGSTTVRMQEGGNPLNEETITYNFIPQAFLNAYIRSYQTTDNVYLIIEEINRGNCAQIFGDLFQLLDRDEEGKSEYTIKADTDLKAYLEETLGTDNEGIKDGEICLPSNLYIYATMNTSDQSLFPIDSAFKRRWDWEYEPIKYKNTDWVIDINGEKFSWVSFQRIVNSRILASTNSEDKMLGDYFVNPHNKIITDTLFLNKILFYLWNDVCKDGEGEIFKTSEDKEVSFSELYGNEGTQTLIKMMEYLGVEKVIDNSTQQENHVTETNNIFINEDDDMDNNDDEGNDDRSSTRDTTRYSINGGESFKKTEIGLRTFLKYTELHKNMSTQDILDEWKKQINAWRNRGLKIPPHLIEDENGFQEFLNNSNGDRSNNERRFALCKYNGEKLYLWKNWGDGEHGNIEPFMEAINNSEWGITIERN